MEGSRPAPSAPSPLARVLDRGVPAGRLGLAAGCGLALLLAALAFATATAPAPAVASRMMGEWGGGRTEVWVQNLDPLRTATVIGRFYRMAGDPPDAPVEIVRRNIGPWEMTRFISPESEGFPAPAGALDQYAVIIESDRRIAAVNLTEEPFTGAAVAYTDVPAAERLVVPLALRGFSKQRGGTEVSSLVSVESADPTGGMNATFHSRLWFWEFENNTRVYRSLPNRPITHRNDARGTGGTWAIDLDGPEFDEGTRPDGYEGSVGWMMLEAESGNRIAAQSFVNLQTVNRAPAAYESFAVSSFAGIPIERRAQRLFAPLFRSRFYGITGISVVNPDPARPVFVRTTYQVSPLSGSRCAAQAGRAVAHRAEDGGEYVEIEPSGSAVFYQFGRDDPAGSPPVQAPGSVGDPGLLPECFGSALIEVDPDRGGTILAMVNDFIVSGRVATADGYDAVRLEDAHDVIAVPMVRHDAEPVADSLYPRAATGIQVMNLADVPATVTLRFVEPAGGFGPIRQEYIQTQQVGPNQAATFYTGGVDGIRDRRDFLGSAMVKSDAGQPLAVTATIVRGGFDAVTYNGFRADLGSPIGAGPPEGRLAFASLETPFGR